MLSVQPSAIHLYPLWGSWDKSMVVFSFFFYWEQENNAVRLIVSAGEVNPAEIGYIWCMTACANVNWEVGADNWQVEWKGFSEASKRKAHP